MSGTAALSSRSATPAIGIPPQDHERIFDRHFRSGAANGTGVHGSGLGLAIVKEIVAQHEGSVEVESRPGHGSTFTVTLPLVTA